MRVGVDIGGTFTDVVAFDEQTGTFVQAKALSTPANLASGVRHALEKSAAPMAEASVLIHGSTVVVNAIIERTGARTALLTTRGFRDVYEIGRINRPESFNPRFRKHRPLIPREHIFEVPERILADGSVRLPLDEAAVRAIARLLRREAFEAIAIVFLHSYAAPEHELRAREILLEENPAWFVSASHELSREYREYERTSTTAANAFVGPVVSAYLGELDRVVRAQPTSFGGELLIMQSNGGVSDLELARQQCVQMLESGPAGGLVGAVVLCEGLAIERAIAFDMGGTTAKAGVVQRGVPSLSPDYFIGGYNEGLVIRVPVLDIVEVGTGGGSMAWIDAGGGLHVGPRSAGAEPGPAAYGHGGTEPTVTDANLVLGRLSADALLGGETRLDREAAERALCSRIAAPLATSLDRAAAGMLEVANAAMANAVRQVTLQRGLDPRDFVLFAYGGGGPLHASAIAHELQIRTVIVPRAPGVFSAMGMLMADMRRDYVQTRFSRLDDLEMADLEHGFAVLQAQGQADLARAGIPAERVMFERAADMRYVGQEHSVAVSLPFELSRESVKRHFDDAHEQRYSHSASDEPAELVSLRLTAIGRMNRPELPRVTEGGSEPPSTAQRASRQVFFAGCGYVETTVFERQFLQAGNVIKGPSLIEEDGSTTVLEGGDTLTVNEFGHLVIST